MSDPNLPAGVPDPADLPQMVECPDCLGDGFYLRLTPYRDVCPTDRGDEIREGEEEEEVECETCKGKGVVEPEAPEYTDEWNGDE